MSLLLLLGDTDTNPRTLFASGEQGVWYDPAGNDGASQSKIDSGLTGAAFLAAYPTHSLYTNTTGTSPAVYPGDLVALQIDQARGGLGSLGTELVTNGTFNSDLTGWSAIGGTTQVVTGGVVQITAGVASGGIAQDITTSASAVRIFVRARRVSGSVGALIWGIPRTGGFSAPNTQITLQNTDQWTSYSFVVFREAGAAGVRIYLQVPLGTAVWEFDDVSVREIPGVHRYATTDANRPKLARIPEGGRRNQLSYSEQFDNAAWTKTTVTVSANQAVAPDGSTTADLLQGLSGTNRIRQTATVSSGADHTSSIYVKKAGSSGTVRIVYFDGTSNTFGSDVTLTDDWQRISLPATTTSTSYELSVRAGSSGAATECYIWGAQLETGDTATNYQKVTLTEDVTETGKRDCWGLWYQGSQSMITPSVDFSSTDKMTVWAGVRKLSDAARGTIAELTATVASNNGGFHLAAPNAASDTFAFESKGTTLTDAIATGVAAPATRVVCGIGDISGDIATLRLNGVQADSDTGDQGSGNYANAALFFGRRNNASLPFNGIEFGTIIRGAATTDSTIRAIEKWMAQRTGITI